VQTAAGFFMRYPIPQLPSRVTTKAEANAVLDTLFPIPASRQPCGSIYYECRIILDLVANEQYPFISAATVVEERLRAFMDWLPTAKIYKRARFHLTYDAVTRFSRIIKTITVRYHMDLDRNYRQSQLCQKPDTTTRLSPPTMLLTAPAS
jgi:hypothetical protein